MAKSRFVYRGDDRDAATATRKANQTGGMYDSYIKSEVKSLKVKEGENYLRILPDSWPDADVEKWGSWWNIDIYLHYGVGADNATYLCLDKMKGEPCPVCEARSSAIDDEEDSQLRPSWRGLAWAIDRDDEKAGPQVFSIPVTLFREINERSVDKKTKGLIRIDHPDEGYDISFTRKGNDIRTKYSAVEVDRDPRPIHDDEDIQNRWLDYITDNPLPDILVYHDYEHIAKVLHGRSRRGEEQSEDGGRSAERSERRRPREAAEERPARSGRSNGSRPQLDDPEPEREQPRSRFRPRASSDDGADEQPQRRSTRPARGESSDEQDRRPARSSARREADDEGFTEERGGRRGRSEPDTQDETGGDEEPSAAARRSLEQMRNRRRA